MHRGWMPAWLPPLAMYGPGHGGGYRLRPRQIKAPHWRAAVAARLFWLVTFAPARWRKPRDLRLWGKVHAWAAGLEVLAPGEAEDIIIAGMGARNNH